MKSVEDIVWNYNSQDYSGRFLIISKISFPIIFNGLRSFDND